MSFWQHQLLKKCILVPRGRTFWSAPRITTSGQVQQHSGFEWLCKHNTCRLRPEPIRFLSSDSEHVQSDGKSVNRRLFGIVPILVPRGHAPFGQHQESRPLAMSNIGSPRFTDFGPSLCACSESSLSNLIGSSLNLLCLQIHSKLECHWTGPEVAILGTDQNGTDQKEHGLWGRECIGPCQR